MHTGLGRYQELRLPTDSVANQIRNKAAWNDGRSAGEADFFTIGYIGRSIEETISILKSAQVESVLDIRHTPLSIHRPEYNKRNLERSLLDSRISYWHIPTLGVPRDIRGRAVGKENRDDIWEWYDRVVERICGKNLYRFFNAFEHPVAFMCVELDPTSCHRHRLAMALERHGLRGFDL